MLSGLVVEQEQQAENVDSTNRSQQTGCLLIVSVTKRPADCEGAVKQITEGCAGLKSPEIRGNPLAIEGKVIDQALDEITAVDRRSKIADAGIGARGDSHWKQLLRDAEGSLPLPDRGHSDAVITRPTRTMNTAGKTIPVIGTNIAGSQAAANSPVIKRP